MSHLRPLAQISGAPGYDPSFFPDRDAYTPNMSRAVRLVDGHRDEPHESDFRHWNEFAAKPGLWASSLTALNCSPIEYFVVNSYDSESESDEDAASAPLDAVELYSKGQLVHMLVPFLFFLWPQRQLVTDFYFRVLERAENKVRRS